MDCAYWRPQMALHPCFGAFSTLSSCSSKMRSRGRRHSSNLQGNRLLCSPLYVISSAILSPVSLCLPTAARRLSYWIHHLRELRLVALPGCVVPRLDWSALPGWRICFRPVPIRRAVSETSNICTRFPWRQMMYWFLTEGSEGNCPRLSAQTWPNPLASTRQWQAHCRPRPSAPDAEQKAWSVQAYFYELSESAEFKYDVEKQLLF